MEVIVTFYSRRMSAKSLLLVVTRALTEKGPNDATQATPPGIQFFLKFLIGGPARPPVCHEYSSINFL
jgi:hypothetical protein